jgi:outer membrane protein insertion porin family
MRIPIKKSFFYVCVVLFLALHVNALAQGIEREQRSTGLTLDEESLAQAPQEEAPAPRDAAQPMVTAVEIKGNTSVSTTAILSKLKTRKGAPFTENISSDDLKRLYLLGFFEDIKIDTEPFGDGVKVIITVQERPVIEKMVFKGFRRVRIRKIEKEGAGFGMSVDKQLKTKEGGALDNASLNDDLRTISEWYEKAGYPYAKVTYDVQTDPQSHKATITFTSVEGKRARIANVNVEGNTAFKDRRITKLMKSKRAWLFNRGVLKEETLKEDMERVGAFYRQNGYADVAVAYDTQSRQAKAQLLYITVKVTEGRQYHVGTVEIKGNQDITRDLVMKELKDSAPAKVFSQEGVRQDIARVQSLYFDKGYISAAVQETVSLNPDTGKVDIVYAIQENEIAYVNRINMRGNVKTKDIVIRRELRIHPGDRFDGTKLKRSRERLQNLGYFEEINYDIEDTDDPAKKDLVVDVKEAKTGAFSFGGGYSTVEQFVGFIEVEQKNFDWRNFPYFTGAGQDLKARASFGTVSQGFDLSFTEPWLFDYPVSFGFDLYKRSRQRESDLGYGYDEDVTGGDLRLGKELSEYVKGGLTYRYEEIKITNISETATQDLKNEEGANTISSMTPSLTYDSRDNVFDTHRGDVLSASLETAGGVFGGDKDFWKLFCRGSHFFPMFRESALEVRLRLGIADTYAHTERVPIYDRFFAGGAYSIRGYEERSIGPLDAASADPLGGESMVIGNIEYTYPLLEFLKVAAFYDTGNVWSKASDIGSDKLYSSVGLGVRIKTPIGPIMLDYGIPLDTAPGEEDIGSGKFHFSASHGF